MKTLKEKFLEYLITNHKEELPGVKEDQLVASMIVDVTQDHGTINLVLDQTVIELFEKITPQSLQLSFFTFVKENNISFDVVRIQGRDLEGDMLKNYLRTLYTIFENKERYSWAEQQKLLEKLDKEVEFQYKLLSQ